MDKGWFRRLEPGEEPPPPPEWIIEWTCQSIGGVCGGLAWGGWRGLLLAREAGISKTPKQTATNYFVHGALWGGRRVGIFAALFSGVALIAENVRTKRDALNYACGGAAAALPFMRYASLSSGLPLAAGATIGGGALGAVQMQLEHLAGDKIFRHKPKPVPDPALLQKDVMSVVTQMQTQAISSSLLAKESTLKQSSKSES